MNGEAAKYSRIEYERRFLVAPESDWRQFVEPFSKTYDDKYLAHSRLRLGILTDSDSDRRLIKLTKKFESDSAYFRQLTTIILSPEEYRIFDTLEGRRLKKIRHYHHFQNRFFSVDVFEGELEGLILCEIESDSLEDLMNAAPPGYIKCEVTEDVFFTGGNLSNTTSADLSKKLASIYG